MNTGIVRNNNLKYLDVDNRIKIKKNKRSTDFDCQHSRNNLFGKVSQIKLIYTVFEKNIRKNHAELIDIIPIILEYPLL